MTTATSRARHGQGQRIVEALNREWRGLVDDHPAAAGTWVTRHPDLAGCRDLADVLARTREVGDAALHALLTEAQRGDALAARTILQAMLGAVVRRSLRDPYATADDYVAALWCVLARYPLATRPRSIAGNLVLDTLKEVQRDSRWWSRGEAEAWLPGDELGPLLDSRWQRDHLDHGPASGLAATEVLQAGRELRLLDEPASRLLHHVYVEGLSGVEAAEQTGSTAGSVRVRCSRAVRRLAEHATELAAAA
jgi:DNA-directed RNA polymerase specialized sigma24 family protein